MRALAEVSADLDVFLSAYLPSVSREDVEMNASFIRSREEAIRNALSGELEEDFDRTFVVDEELLHHELVSDAGRAVAGVEAFTGAFMIALFVLVFGRRMIR